MPKSLKTGKKTAPKTAVTRARTGRSASRLPANPVPPSPPSPYAQVAMLAIAILATAAILFMAVRMTMRSGIDGVARQAASAGADRPLITPPTTPPPAPADEFTFEAVSDKVAP